MKPATTLAVIFLALVSAAHLARLVLRIDVTAGGWAVPMWPSAIACAFTGVLAILLWRESRR